MPDTITVKIKNLQPNDYTLQGAPIILKEGDNLVRIDHWLIIRDSMSKKISNGFVSVDQDEETRAIESFKQSCFSEFEVLGVPSVKVSSDKGALSKGVKHLMALEWLELKSELRELSRDDREEKNLSISRRGVIWAAIAVLVAIVAIYVNGQSLFS